MKHMLRLNIRNATQVDFVAVDLRIRYDPPATAGDRRADRAVASASCARRQDAAIERYWYCNSHFGKFSRFNWLWGHVHWLSVISAPETYELTVGFVSPIASDLSINHAMLVSSLGQRDLFRVTISSRGQFVNCPKTTRALTTLSRSIWQSHFDRRR